MKTTALKVAPAALALVALMAVIAAAPLSAQTQTIKKAYLGQAMSDFALPALDGPAVKLSELKGKNVLLVFPRVFYATEGDCSICGYQYAELADGYQASKWREKFDLEVLVVFPFSAEVTRAWLGRVPAMLEAVEGWKNPSAEDLKNEQAKRWMEVTRQAYPKKYAFTAESLPMPFRIVIDEQRELSKGLDLFREEWSGGKGEQNIPSVFLLDKEGVVQFKLVGQHTLDRPTAAYLEKIMEAVL
jgi:peroxiredoxin